MDVEYILFMADEQVRGTGVTKKAFIPILSSIAF
jgi:hypothetical protein